MIFAISSDDQTLTVFPSEEEAIAYCEGFDVASGNWLFFNDNGSPLRAEFLVPAGQSGIVVTHGVYHLCSSGGSGLDQLLDATAAIEGPNGFRSKDDVRLYLANPTR